MKVIVTGGTGLIGTALAEALVARGDAVVVTSRSPSTASVPRGVETAAWDARSAEALTPVVEGADAVVHLVGEGIGDGRWSAARKQRIRDSRVDSSAAVAAAIAAATARPRTLLQGSAVGFYGDRGDERLTEGSAAGDGFLAEVCGEWEAASAPVEEGGTRRVLLRTGVVLANEGGALPRMALPFRLFAGGPVGSGGQWVPWIHIADEVGAILHLLDTPAASGPVNLTAPGEATNRALSKALGKVLSRPSFLPAPAFAMKLLLGEMSQLLLASQRVVPQELDAGGYSFRFPSIEGALSDLLG